MLRNISSESLINMFKVITVRQLKKKKGRTEVPDIKRNSSSETAFLILYSVQSRNLSFAYYHINLIVFRRLLPLLLANEQVNHNLVYTFDMQ